MPVNTLNEQYSLKNGRPTIAVLAGLMSSSYQEGIIRGIAHAAEEKDYNVITFCGGAVGSKDPLTFARDKIFDLVDMNFIDGVISPFSSQLRFLDDQASQAFIEQFSAVPIVNIGSHIQTHTNVLSDFEIGFGELFEHLHSVHGYRHILFMRGPQTHGSSDQRLDIYKRLLAKYQLPFDEELVIYADLNKSSAKENIEHFFENTNKPYDAVITINDNQALGVLDACKERGIKVPEELAIFGSMNTLEGEFASPAITSIDEPVFALGRAAAIELIGQIEGKEPLPELYIPTSLVIKQSCGCNSGSVQEDNTKTLSAKLNKEQILKETKATFAKLVEHYKGGVLRNESSALLTLYLRAIDEQNVDLFMPILKQKVNQVLRSEDVVIWLAIIARLQVSTLKYLELNGSSTTLFSMLTQLLSLNSEIQPMAIKYQRYEKIHYMNSLRMILTSINSSFDLSMIRDNTLDALQLSEFYISTFQGKEKATSTNILSIRDNQILSVKNSTFIAKHLLPDELLPHQKRYCLMVFPLSFSHELLGFMALNLSPRSGHAFENLRAIISSALKNERLIQELQKAEKRFSDIAHSASNWLWETDNNLCFNYCSDSSLEIVGYAPDALLGKKIEQLTINNSNRFIEKMLNYEDLVEVECWLQHQDGNAICLLVSAKAIFSDNNFNGYRGIFDDITENKLQEEKIKKLAYFDLLTGLPNRTLFQDKLAETIASSQQYKQKFALMFIDLDRFKDINDSMGHAAGDILLIKLAERLTQSVFSNDILARLGGDEFIIILPNIEDGKEVIEVVNRIFTNIQKPFVIHDKSIYCSLSLGVSVYPNDGEDAQSLLQKGDNAMYQAKSKGRNGYVFYDKKLEKKYGMQ